MHSETVVLRNILRPKGHALLQQEKKVPLQPRRRSREPALTFLPDSPASDGSVLFVAHEGAL